MNLIKNKTVFIIILLFGITVFSSEIISGKMDRVENYLYQEEQVKKKDNDTYEDDCGSLTENSDIRSNPIKVPLNKNTPEIIKNRLYKIEETFILTDNTKANTFRINTEKTWKSIKDNLMISLDIFAQTDDNGEMRVKTQRFEFDYKFYFYNYREKRPFFEYCYSTDKPTGVNWKVFSGGIRKKMPLSSYLDIGYGYKWGNVSKKEIYQYDVFAVNLNNKKTISNITLEQNLKTITPRSVQQEKQPIFDYQSSISIPIVENLNGTINFDWRYQKIPTISKDEWFNYTLKFGLTFIPRK